MLYALWCLEFIRVLFRSRELAVDRAFGPADIYVEPRGHFEIVDLADDIAAARIRVASDEGEGDEKEQGRDGDAGPLGGRAPAGAAGGRLFGGHVRLFRHQKACPIET